ncbi:MAG: SRPBCC family protein [Rubrivivax sp.]
MTTTQSKRHIAAPPERVYRLLTDRDAVQRWRVPDGMTSHVHAFDPREGGSFRVSLTYDAAEPTGKTSAHTDTYHGRFVSLIPHHLVVERMAFETDDPAMAGEMTVTYTLFPSGSGTDLLAVHEGVPDGVSATDNELGWRMALDKLAALAESQAGLEAS